MVRDISGRYEIGSLYDLDRLAQRVADDAEAGDVLFLEGDLGAGKTAFVKALGLALLVGEQVTSPTFTVAAEYDVPHSHIMDQLVHVDLYRLGAAAAGEVEAEDAHVVNEMMEMAGQLKRLVVIEWANKLPLKKMTPGLWKERVWRLRFDYGQKETERVVTVEKVDPSNMPPAAEATGPERYPKV